jgi:hypothetical protein
MTDELKFLSQLLGEVPVANGINFSNRCFSEPMLFRFARPASLAGLYAILVYDTRCSPRPYRVIYFGQAGDIAARVRDSHEKYFSWGNAARGTANLYVAFHWMSGSSERQRCDAESVLVRDYNPECNIVFNALSGLSGRRSSGWL